jgi:hypothetical protein
MQRVTTKEQKTSCPAPGPIRQHSKIHDNEDAPKLAEMFAIHAQKYGLSVSSKSYLGKEFASFTDNAKRLDSIMESALSNEAKNRMGGFINARKILIPIILQHLEQNKSLSIT